MSLPFFVGLVYTHRALTRGDMALVELALPHKIVVDYHGNACTALCRVILRDRGSTIAAGMVVDPSDA